MDRINFIYSYLKNTKTITGYFPIYNSEFLSNCKVEAIVEDDSLIPTPDVIEVPPSYFLLENSTEFDEYYLTVDIGDLEFDLIL